MGWWHCCFLASVWRWRVAWQVNLGTKNGRTLLGQVHSPMTGMAAQFLVDLRPLRLLQI